MFPFIQLSNTPIVRSYPSFSGANQTNCFKPQVPEAFDDNAFRNLSKSKDAQNITELDLRDTPIRDFSPLQRFCNLTKVWVTQTDVSAICNLLNENVILIAETGDSSLRPTVEAAWQKNTLFSQN